jgi:Xaa-Pro dipeptidase
MKQMQERVLEKAVKKGSENLDIVLKLLKENGLGGLIIYAYGAYQMFSPTYVYYFSGFRPSGMNSAVVISRSGNAVLLIEPQVDVRRATEKTWITNVKGTSNFTADLVSAINELNITGKLGITGSRNMNSNLYQGIDKSADIVMADDILEEFSREKIALETVNISRLAHIAEIGFDAFVHFAQPGIREYEIAAEVGYAMRAAGAEDIFLLLSSGKHNYALHTPSDRRLNKGDIVIGEISPVYKGQFTQLCRTVVIGQPDTILSSKYNLLVQALHESLVPIKAGYPAAMISRTINKIIGDAGYPEYCCPPYMRARGHGIGPGCIVGSSKLGGTIDDNTTAILKNNQMIVVHPNQYFPETGYLTCGETVLVTDSGIKRLSATETKLYWKEV